MADVNSGFLPLRARRIASKSSEWVEIRKLFYQKSVGLYKFLYTKGPCFVKLGR